MQNADNETFTITLPRRLAKILKQWGSPQAFIQEAVEFYLRHKQSEPEPAPEPTDGTGLCGIWDDPGSAEEIGEEIIAARTPGREFAL